MSNQINAVLLALLFLFCFQAFEPAPLLANSCTVFACAVFAKPSTQFQEDDKESEPDEQNKRRKKKSKIRFSDWPKLVDWMFSTEKWEPITKMLWNIYKSIFDISVLPQDPVHHALDSQSFRERVGSLYDWKVTATFNNGHL